MRDVPLQDKDTLFFGPRKYIEDLWQIIKWQKLRIDALQQQLPPAHDSKHHRAARSSPGA